MIPKDEKEWQERLNVHYANIQYVAEKTGSKDWATIVPTLRNEVIRPARWIIRKMWPKNTVATVIHPPGFSDGIDLFELFWNRSQAEQCATLIHEWIHVCQRHQGKLNYIRYVTSKKYRNEVEEPAYDEQKLFYSWYIRLFH